MKPFLAVRPVSGKSHETSSVITSPPPRDLHSGVGDEVFLMAVASGGAAGYWQISPRNQSRTEANYAELQSRTNPNYARGPGRSMTKIPLEQATLGIKAALAECILKAAANGQTSYEGLIAAASEQIQTILSVLT